MLIFLVSTVLLSLDNNSWKYSTLGDDWSLHSYASHVLRAGPFTGSYIFGPLRDGIYSVHSPFISFIQAVVMSLFGENNFGWRMSGILSLTLSIFPIAVISRYFLERRTTYLVVIGVVWSYYLLVESKWGYGWGLMRLFPLCAVASLVTFRKSPSIWTAIVVAVFTSTSDLIGGFGKYVALLTTAYATVLIFARFKERRVVLFVTFLSVLLLTSKIPQHLYGAESGLQELQHTLWKTSAGPYIASILGPEWGGKFEETAPAPEKFWNYFFRMSGRTILAPVSFRANVHLVVGRVVEPIWGYLVLAGMLLSLRLLLIDRRWISMWVFFIPGLVLAGTLSPYGVLAVTRLHFLVPMWGIFAGLAFERIVPLFVRRKQVMDGVTILYACWIVLWGSHTFWVKTPQRYEFGKSQLAMKLIEESPENSITFAFDSWHPLDLVFPHFPHPARVEILTNPSLQDLRARFQSPDSLLVFPLESHVPDRDRATYREFVSSLPPGAQCLPYRYGNQILFDLCRKTVATPISEVH